MFVIVKKSTEMRDNVKHQNKFHTPNYLFIFFVIVTNIVADDLSIQTYMKIYFVKNERNTKMYNNNK